MSSYKQRFSLTSMALPMIRQNLRDVLTRWQIDQDIQDNAMLVISEYLSNLIRHGDAKWRSIWLSMGIESSSLWFEAWESGNYFDPSCYFNSIVDETYELREGGMGLALIAQLTRAQLYSSQNGVHCFKFTIETG